jgi:hypothetical protein
MTPHDHSGPNDITWTKTTGRRFDRQRHRATAASTVNIFTGQSIRKGHGMTGQDWFIFDSNDNITGRSATPSPSRSSNDIDPCTGHDISRRRRSGVSV